MPLPTRKIGLTDVPHPGLGCMGMSAAYVGANNEERNLQVLKLAYEKGCRFLDTADVYGENERFLGKALPQLGIPREDLFIATKFGNVVLPDGTPGVNGKPEYVKQAMASSLSKLGLPSVDLYYQHRVDANTPIEETVKAMDELRKEGKTKYIGLSECNAETLRRANKVAKIDALQIEYSLWTTDIEKNGLLEACKELGIAIVAYSPLGRGFLSGTIQSLDSLPEDDRRRATHPRFTSENFKKNLELVEKIKVLAAKKGCTPSQLALAWVEDQWDGILSIPGTTKPERLEENLESVNVRFTEQESKELREIIDGWKTAGERYPPGMMKNIGL